MSVASIFFLVAGGLSALIILWLLLWKLYERSSAETAFVRTGFLGSRVIINGGALVIPVLHSLTRVNMNTLCITLHKAQREALTTRDKLKMDVGASFYVRVEATRQGVERAAQTLGRRTLSGEELAELLAGEFVDALRAIAAGSDLNALHENRHQFAAQVQQVLAENLMRNGLLLEAVSITQLDQTDREHFNPNNVLDAEGLYQLAQAIEARRLNRNAVEQDTQVAVQRKNLEAERQLLEIQQEEELARLAQESAIAFKRARTGAEIATAEAEEKQRSESARVQAESAIEEARAAAQQQLESKRIALQQKVQEEEIAARTATEIAQVAQRKSVELAEQAREIAIAQRAVDQTSATVKAEEARALAVEAEEKVATARELERTRRTHEVALLQAKTVLDQELERLLRTAEAEHQAAQAQARAVGTQVKAEVEAERLRIAAGELRAKMEAEARRLINEADNTLGEGANLLRVRLALIERLEAVVRESVKPLEKIESIKIVQFAGLQPGSPSGPAAAGTTDAASASLSDQVVSSALKYRAQAPIIDMLLREAGLDPAQVFGKPPAQGEE